MIFIVLVGGKHLEMAGCHEKCHLKSAISLALSS